MIKVGDSWVRLEAVVAILPWNPERCQLSLSNGHSITLDMPAREVADIFRRAATLRRATG